MHGRYLPSIAGCIGIQAKPLYREKDNAGAKKPPEQLSGGKAPVVVFSKG
jgi:hypothetical protein